MELLLSRMGEGTMPIPLQFTAQVRLHNGRTSHALTMHRQISALSENLAKRRRKYPGLKGSIPRIQGTAWNKTKSSVLT